MRQFPKELRKEFNIFKKLNTPKKIQDFLVKIPANFENNGETSYTPRMTLFHNRAHCMEGALLAAAALWYHGEKPLLLDLKTTPADHDHVVALFKRNNRWGAISKTNHAVLRYRDPVYATVRELALSYFHEYFLDDGKKNLREFSAPFSLLDYENEWLTSDENTWAIVDDLDDSQHFQILPKLTSRNLRPADPIEIKAGKIVDWKNH